MRWPSSAVFGLGLVGSGFLCCVPDETERVGYERRHPRSRCLGGAGRTRKLVARSVQSLPCKRGRTGTGRAAMARGFGCGTFSERIASVADARNAQIDGRRAGVAAGGVVGQRCSGPFAPVGRSVASDERRGRSGSGRGRPLGNSRNATWLILPVVICLSQRLSHACVSMNKFRL